MTNSTLRPNSLVLYKNRAARIVSMDAKKLSLDVAGGKSVKVRPKDVILLHGGPLTSLAQLTPQVVGDVETAWELLAGETTTLAELAELAFDKFTPQTAWTTWQLVAAGVYFSGTPDKIVVQSAEMVAEIRAKRAKKAAEEQEWADFLARVDAREIMAEDGRFLQEVVAVANRQRKQSKLLKTLKMAESEENAHQLLLSLGYWTAAHNPHPARAGVDSTQPSAPIPELPDEPRRDLTHLAAFAIDDAGNTDPDDAISWDNGRFYIHIADVAALVSPDSPADLEARGRGANLYLPEGTITMLPSDVTAVLGLGLTEISPALTFCLTLDADSTITDTEIMTSWVRVTRISYQEAEGRLDESPFREMVAVTSAFEARRRENDSVNIELPEVRVRVKDGMVGIRPLPTLHSRNLVRDAMLMTGEAVARFAFANNIPIPYTIQDAPAEPLPEASTPSEMFGLRRKMSPSRQGNTPGAHFGLGLGMYVQTTSPLRRYLDLVVHQQLRAHLRGDPLLDEQAVMERVGSAAALARELRYAERQSNRHWTLIYFQQNSEWQGEAIIVDKRGKRDVALIPTLAWETRLFSKKELLLDSTVTIKLRDVDIPQLSSRFELVS